MLQFAGHYGYLFQLVTILAIVAGLWFGKTLHTHPRSNWVGVPLNLLSLFLLGYGAWNSSVPAILSAVLLLCFEMCALGTGEYKSHMDERASRKTLIKDGLFVLLTPFALLAIATVCCTTLL